jgi:hypothetical protein
MNLSKKLTEALRLGGSNAVALFIDTCLSVREDGGAEAAARWIALTLPMLPESDRAEVVAALVEAIADGEAEFESYPSTELH